MKKILLTCALAFTVLASVAQQKDTLVTVTFKVSAIQLNDFLLVNQLGQGIDTLSNVSARRTFIMKQNAVQVSNLSLKSLSDAMTPVYKFWNTSPAVLPKKKGAKQ